ncbi:unnamed protein product [Rotaria sp. Silwood2]|nr:unnamed protein product [Rotaria sp. Silwood2]
MLKGLIPLKIHDNEIIPSGQIFIGLATHQSTGIGMHVFSHLMPTIERENVDLQDPYISIWNEQLLTSIGKIIRFIYDQTVVDLINNTSQISNQQLNAILSLYAFQPSAPNKDIGRILLDGFFSSDKDILVPVKRSPSDLHLSLCSSTEAYLTTSKHIQTFLPIPLVPYDLGQNDFFKVLKRHHWIEEIDHDTILVKVQESILQYNEFVGLLHWLCSNDVHNKSYIKQILSKIRYRETYQSSIIKLEKIEFYDTLNLLSLPLPSNVLPSNVINHISREDLHKRLSLSIISMKNLIEFYLADNQQYLFQNENTTRILLSFISQRWNQFNEKESNKIKDILSNLKCISTSQGMKSPNESYIRSSNLSDNLPIIKFYIPQISIDKEESNDYPVSIEFLKSVGCRTIHIPTLTSQSNNSFNDLITLQNFIQNLLQQRKTMSDNDLHALKHNPCIIGITLESNGGTKHKYKPCDLHFPSVADRLQWNQLLIIDWLDINPRSQEYAFLKELGVREVPDLHKLISRIDQEHNYGTKIKEEYKLPNALIFFAENFQQYYSKVWKNANIKIPFLPSILPDINQSTEVTLTTPDIVFKESGPLCPSLLPEVLRCFSKYFDIGLLGVKQRPLLSIAFDILMEKRNQLLNVESASIYFSYFNKLDGLNRTFIERISNRAFIPLPGSNIYLKPSQVFIRSKNSFTNETSSNNDLNITDDMTTHGLIDYIDYGHQANSFLLSIGVLSYPSAENLADLLIERQASFFAQMKDNTNDMISTKLRVYTNCLKQLAAISNSTKHLNVEPLRSRLINKPWCLAYQIIERSEGNRERIFKIAKPIDIYLDDDHQSAIDLRPLCAPDEPELTKLYELFGSKWLSESVKRTLIHRGKFFVTDRSKKLHDLIRHRLDMLFVNNRGERLDNIDEKSIELLRTKFFVYETEGIQCQLTFQNRTITLNSTECSSCALEHEKNKVTLYIQKDISTLDYIDIATELTRFVYKKPLDALVHSISDKLASPLETLKRRGIPVDRLLKLAPQQLVKLELQNEKIKIEKNNVEKLPLKQQESLCQSEEIEKFDQNQQNDQIQRGFFQSLKDFLVPNRYSSSSSFSNNSIENISSTIERDRINNFGQNKSFDEADIRTMIRTSRTYSAKEFNQSEHSRNESNNSCEYIPPSNMIRYDHLLYGISLYIDCNLTLTDAMIDQGKQLARLLSGLAKDVFSMPVQTMHLFRDIDSARIAFNNNGALFFNLRYFEQIFADDLKAYLPNASSSIPIVRTIINFYYMVACHELSHNIDSSHDLNFINRLEKVSVRFMDLKDTFLSKFSFQ